MVADKNNYNADGTGMISVVVPVFNEQDNVCELVENIAAAMSSGKGGYELIMVDDGSSDETVKRLVELQSDKVELPIKIIELRRNFGQTAAIAAGFDHAHGDIIVPMDGDLQNDASDIPKLVAKLNEGYDVVSGWRRHRKDKLITRKLPSWTANFLIGLITGVKLHDYGCTLKAYHKDVVANLNLYGEMHRFIPAIASWSGARVTEMEVEHHHRTHGKSKYGLQRTAKVMLDLITVKFLGSFSTRPLHIFGGIGMLAFLASLFTCAVMIYQKVYHNTDMDRTPLLTLTAMLAMMSVQFLLMGLLAEMMCRTYHESQSKSTYAIRRIIDRSTSNKDFPVKNKGNTNG